MKVISLLHTSFVNDNRVARMASAIAELGHEVSVVAIHKAGLKMHEHEKAYSVKRIRPISHGIPRWNLIIGSIHFFEFIMKATWEVRKADALICNDIEAFVIGLLAKFFNQKLKLVYDCHELESERMGKGKLNRAFVRWVESRFIQKSKLVVTVSPSIQSWYEKTYELSHVLLVRNIPEVINAVEGNHVFHDKFKLHPDQKICLYQGALMPGRGLEMLMNAFDAFPTSEYVLVLMGGGKMAAEIELRAKTSDKIFFHPLVNANEIGRYTGSAHCGINSVEPQCLSYAYCLPNKLFETVLSEIPILTNNLVDCAALVEKYGVGTVIQSWNIESIQSAVKEICAIPRVEF